MKDTKYYSAPLWEYDDRDNTQNRLTIVQSVSRGISYASPIRLNVQIRNRTTGSNAFILFSYSKVETLLNKFELIFKDFSLLCEHLDAGVKIPPIEETTRGTKLVVQLTKNHTIGSCAKIWITKRAQPDEDDLFILVPLMEFISFIRVVKNFRDNYALSSSLIPLVVSVDDIHNKMSSIEEHLGSLAKNIGRLAVSLESDKTKSVSIEPESRTPEISQSMVWDEEEVRMQKEMEKFLKAELPNTKLDVEVQSDIDKSIDKVSPRTLNESKFTYDFLNGDIKNLELLISNCLLDSVPLDWIMSEFSKGVEKVELDCDDRTYGALMFATTKYCKHYILRYTQEQKILPEKVIPFVYNISEKEESETLGLLYTDLFIYSVYYTLVRNILRDKSSDMYLNKDIICFILKSVTSPIIFSRLRNLSNRESFLGNIRDTYNRYVSDGIFEPLEKDIADKLGADIRIPVSSIISTASSIIESVNTNWDLIVIENSIKSLSTDELHLMDYTFDDIPVCKNREQILELLSPEQRNLEKYIHECKLKKDLLDISMDVCSSIINSYRDIEETTMFQLNRLPDNVVKAIYLWDTEVDMAVTQDYKYYKEKVDSSSMTKEMIISIIGDLNSTDVVKDDFLGAIDSEVFA